MPADKGTTPAVRHASSPEKPGTIEKAPAHRPLFVWLLGGGLLVVIGLLVARPLVPFDADLYDEGLICNGARLALRGQWPGASYYAPYPPGAFAALALAFHVWGTRVLVERWFAAALAALAGGLGFGLITGFPEASSRAHRRQLISAGLAGLASTLLLGSRWVTPVNGGALLLVIASGLALRAALPRGRADAALGVGALIGAAALWRLDFGLYAFEAGLLVWVLLAGYELPERPDFRRRLLGAMALGLGTLLVIGPPLVLILLQGGRRAADSLFWWPLTSTGAQRLPWARHAGAFLMPLVSLGLAVVAAPALARDRRRGAAALWLLLLGIGFLAYSLGRTHSTPLFPLRIVSMLLAGLCAGAIDATKWAHASRLAFLTIFVATVTGPVREYFHALRFPATRRVSLPGSRGAGVFPPPREADGYRRILAALAQELPPGAALFCGTPRHDIFLKDDNLAYFLSNRESGTYFWCLDADVTTTAAVQAEMIRELEAAPVEAVLIRTASVNHEPNASSRSSGVHALDDYLRRRYRPVVGWPDYQIWRRRRSTD